MVAACMSGSPQTTQRRSSRRVGANITRLPSTAPFPNLVMVYAPRDAEDLEVVMTIVGAAATYATGTDDTP